MQALLPEGFPFPQFYEWADPTSYITHSLYYVAMQILSKGLIITTESLIVI